MFAISNPSQTAYSAANRQKQPRPPQDSKYASPQKKIVKQSDTAAGAKSAARTVSSDPRESYQNASAKKSFNNQNALMSPQRRKDNDPRYN